MCNLLGTVVQAVRRRIFYCGWPREAERVSSPDDEERVTLYGTPSVSGDGSAVILSHDEGVPGQTRPETDVGDADEELRRFIMVHGPPRLVRDSHRPSEDLVVEEKEQYTGKM